MKKILMRSPKISDLKSCLEMANSLIEEKAMLSIQKKLTIKEEREYLKGIIKDKNSLHLFLIIDGEVMGSAKISRGIGITNHVGELGISLKKEARGKGLGEKLIKEVLDKAIKKFNLKIITLDVFAKNKIAQNLYKKMGFQKIGIIKNGVQYFGGCEDSMIMAKYIEK